MLNALFGENTAFGQFLNANIWNTIFSSGFYMPGNFLGTAVDFMGLGGGAGAGAEGAAGAAEGAAGAAGAAEGAAGAAAGPLGGLGAVGPSVSGDLGKAAVVGPLSVPPSWTGAAPQNALGSTLGATPMVAPPPAMAAGMPGMPLGGLGAQGLGRNTPQYGFRPTFVPRPPAAG